MGYAVDYIPTRKRNRRRASRTVPTNKSQRVKDIKQAVRWNLDRLEHDTIGTESVSREMACRLLRFGSIARQADPTGDHVMQQLIHDGVLVRPRSVAGVQVFDRGELLTSLKAWVGVL